MSYCLRCGFRACHQIPQGDNRTRLVCQNPECQYIHYENPKMVCGALVLHDHKILLCRRAIEPRYGFWTLPAGFMENGETMAQGAMRETLEEADAIATNPKLYCLFDLPHLGQIHAMYLAQLPQGEFGCGVESLECALFDPQEIPWQDIAFKTVAQTLERYLDDQATLTKQGKNTDDFNNYPLHQITLDDKPTI